MLTSKIKTIGLILAGIIFGVFAYFFLNNIIIGDPCDYHSNDVTTGGIFNLFYEISSNTGFHPEPSAFNFIFAITTGALIGFLTSRILIKKSAK